MRKLITIKEASKWASEYIGRDVTVSNISYLIQYGRIPKKGDNGTVFVDKYDLEKYYQYYLGLKKDKWKQELGDDLNWDLSFSQYKEAETTKHVHRLHPYKGKFIPQLVEYFLDSHTDGCKKKVFFKKGDIVLDPFCGSGTTLVQASELGLHGIGVDISVFNTFISNIKVGRYDISAAESIANTITRNLRSFQENKNNVFFESELTDELKVFNNIYFPSPMYKLRVRTKEIDERKYGKQKEDEFLKIYLKLIKKYGISLKQKRNNSFIEKWFISVVRDEIDFISQQIASIKDREVKELLSLVLSRTIRSCRATTHADLATLKEPVMTTYYCKKHGKICKPLFSIMSWWKRYVQDTLVRIAEFDKLRTDTFQKCLVGDSRTIDIIAETRKQFPEIKPFLQKKKIAGIFSSPPYVGLIDYHEQHAYAYDLFHLERKDELEIGSLSKGRGVSAQTLYVESIASVLRNCKQCMRDDYNVFLVANDKNALFSKIAECSGMRIVNEYKRPVLNRVEKDRATYSEIIFHMKEK